MMAGGPKIDMDKMAENYMKMRRFLQWQAAQACDTEDICFPCKASEMLDSIYIDHDRTETVCLEKPMPPVCSKCDGVGRTWK